MQRVVAISCRRFGTTYRSHLQGSRIFKGQEFMIPEDGTDILSQNFGKELPLQAAR
jgi:hypothetical protein